MAATDYDVCLKRLLVHEGGYSNHPADPGGPTNFGITIADYRKYLKPGATADNVRQMKVAEAKAIYKPKYWDALTCDDLPAGVDDSIFDYGVNSGVARSGKVLRRVLGLPTDNYRVTPDVIAAANKRDPVALVNAINAERIAFLQRLPTWPTFGTGWSHRVSEVRAFDRSLAKGKGTTDVNPSPAGKPGKGQIPKPTGPKVTTTGGALAGVLAMVSYLHAHPALVAFIVIAICLIALFIHKRIDDKHTKAMEEPLPVPVVPVIATQGVK